MQSPAGLCVLGVGRLQERAPFLVPGIGTRIVSEEQIGDFVILFGRSLVQTISQCASFMRVGSMSQKKMRDISIDSPCRRRINQGRYAKIVCLDEMGPIPCAQISSVCQ